MLPCPHPGAGRDSLVGRVGREDSFLFVQEDTLNTKAEQLQGVDLHPDHQGARLQGGLVSQRSWQRKGALT